MDVSRVDPEAVLVDCENVVLEGDLSGDLSGDLNVADLVRTGGVEGAGMEGGKGSEDKVLVSVR